ncbi:MAG: GGDEF domain-containing protein [Clostridium sp.]|nr:GGDEF domain-containing protein [Clostridium sp.]
MKINSIARRKKARYYKEYLKVTILSLVVVSIIAIAVIVSMDRKVNGTFERYIQTITLSKEHLDEESEMLIKFLEEPALSNRNRGIVSNYMSIMYGFNNQIQESVKYASKALYYFEKANENSSLIEAKMNLSTILVNITSYDMAESILQTALDIKLPEKEEANAHLYIYLNLAETAYQRGDYAQALEAIELAENKIQDITSEKWCEFSLYLTKARTFFGLENYKECKEVVALVNQMVKSNSKQLVETNALSYYELNSLIALQSRDLNEAEFYFEKYRDYCKQHHFNLKELSYIDKFINIAEKFGHQEQKFIKTKKKALLDDYREQLGVITNLNTRIMMEMYNTTADNIRIQAEQGMRRGKLYAGIVLVIFIIVIGIAVIIQTYRRSQVDILTGAYNRAKMRSVYRALLRKKQQFYVIMFDIDNFKMCNDVYGHRFGDTVLERISGSVMKCLPKASLFFRYGGEEFVVLCELKEEEVKQLAEAIRKSVEGLVWENNMKITISVGVSGSRTTVDPLKVADDCLYISKKTGKNRITYSFVQSDKK